MQLSKNDLIVIINTTKDLIKRISIVTYYKQFKRLVYKYNKKDYINK